MSLFDVIENNKALILPKLKNVEDWIGFEMCQAEFEAFGFYLDNHPLSAKKQELTFKGITFINELEEDYIQNRCVVKIAAVVGKTSIKSSQNGRYAFVSVSDPTGLIELVIYSNDLIIQHKELLDDKQHSHLVFECTIDKKDGSLRAMVKEIYTLDNFLRNTPDGAEKIKLKKSFDNFKSFKKKEVVAEKPIFIEEKIVIYENVKIYINSSSALSDLQKVLSNSEYPEGKEKYSNIELIINEGGEVQKISLPTNRYILSDLEVRRIGMLRSIDKVEF